jgi:ketosteroid isomerase-like protein
MFLTTRYVTATVVLLLLQSATSIGQTSDATRTIERLEEELNSAFNRFDSAALDRLWSEDLAFVSPNGTLANKAQRLAGLKSPPPTVPTSTNESVAVKLYGDVAVAIVVSRWTGTSDGRQFSTHFRATHVWANSAGQWKLVAAHVSQMKV